MISDNRSAITLLLMDLKSNRWQREITVSGILCGSVVAKINTTCFGGSSNVFNSALNALVEIIRSEEHTSELQSRFDLVCRLLLEKKKTRSSSLFRGLDRMSSTVC